MFGPITIPVAIRVCLPPSSQSPLSVSGQEVTVRDSCHFFRSSYERVFSCNHAPEEVFAFTAPAVSMVMKGFNAALIVYGQTDTGKTFTLFGNKDKPGLAHRTAERLFQNLEGKKAKNRGYEVTSSWILIHDEHVFDLLREDETQISLFLTETEDLGASIPGLTELRVSSVSECIATIAKAERKRAVFSLPQNVSTVIFRITVASKNASRKGTFRRMTFDLCDLPGSERVSPPSKSRSLNLSLATLEDVVSVLANVGKVSSTLVRQSQLTQLLGRTLCTGYTSFITTISPLPEHVEEAILTLKFADMAKQIPMKLTKMKIAGTNSGGFDRNGEEDRLQIRSSVPRGSGTSEQNTEQDQILSGCGSEELNNKSSSPQSVKKPTPKRSEHANTSFSSLRNPVRFSPFSTDASYPASSRSISPSQASSKAGISYDQETIDHRLNQETKREQRRVFHLKRINDFREAQNAPSGRKTNVLKPLQEGLIAEELKRLEEDKARWKKRLEDRLSKEERDRISLRNRLNQRPKIEPKGVKPRTKDRFSQLLFE